MISFRNALLASYVCLPSFAQGYTQADRGSSIESAPPTRNENPRFLDLAMHGGNLGMVFSPRRPHAAPVEVRVLDLEDGAWEPVGVVPNLGKLQRNCISFFSNTVAVGSRLCDDSRGCVYVFEREPEKGWSSRQVLTLKPRNEGDEFGHSLAMFGPWLAVGRVSKPSPVAMFRYKSGSWFKETELLIKNDRDYQAFGWSLAMWGDLLAVGAPAADSGGANTGCVYLFRNHAGEWTLEGKVSPSDGSPNDAFGMTIALYEHTLAVDSYLKSDHVQHAGAVYVFDKSGSEWVQSSKLSPEKSNSGDQFGASLALDGHRLVVGAPNHKVGGEWSASGAAFVYSREGDEWRQEVILTHDPVKPERGFGRSVGLLGSTIVVGTPPATDLEAPWGAVVVYEADSGEDWHERGRLLSAVESAAR